MKHMTNLKEFYTLKRSVATRLYQLRNMSSKTGTLCDTPMEKSGIFSNEVNVLAKTYKNMLMRLESAKITIQIPDSLD